jgi:hypothetical protein
MAGQFDPQRATNAVPERHRITRSQEFGACKRCLANNTKAGDVIVTHYGRGWWHDACYRIANPSFYDGMPEPQEAESTPL